MHYLDKSIRSAGVAIGREKGVTVGSELTQGRLVSTIYMIPMKKFEEHQKISDLKAPGGNVTNVDMYFNAGHPGVEESHYHIVLWHVPEASESVVEK